MSPRPRTVNAWGGQPPPDGELTAVLSQIANHLEVPIGDDVFISVAKQTPGLKQGVSIHFTQRPNGEPEVALDLVGHAYDGLLHLGNTVITKGTTNLRAVIEETAVLFHAATPNSTHRSWRLLGCATATNGANALAWIQKTIDDAVGRDKIIVYGTKRPISANNFDGGGLHADFGDLLAAEPTGSRHGLVLPTLASMQMTMHTRRRVRRVRGWSRTFHRAELRRWWASLPAERPSALAPDYAGGDWEQALRITAAQPGKYLRRETEAAILQRCFEVNERARWKLVDGGGRSIFDYLGFELQAGKRVPGLLELPHRDILVRAAPAPDDPQPTYHRITLLFGLGYVRLYPHDVLEGLMFRLSHHQQDVLRNMLSSLRDWPPP